MMNEPDLNQGCPVSMLFNFLHCRVCICYV